MQIFGAEFSLGLMHTFRACLNSYIVLTICVGLTPAIALVFALRSNRNAIWIVAIGTTALLFTYFWLSRFKLTITPHSVIYSSLFTGERTIDLSEVHGSDTVYESGLYGSRYLLAVNARGMTTRINFKVFSREAARALFHLVGPNQALEPTVGRRDEQI